MNIVFLFFQKSSYLGAFDCKSKGETILLDIIKFISTQNLVIFLIIKRIKFGIILSNKRSFFKYIFFLIYVGAILVLIIYLFFSSYKISSFKKILYIIIVSLLMGRVLKNSLIKNIFSKNFIIKFYAFKELKFLILLCSYIFLILLCILKIDYFRFSSLRNLL